MYRTFKGDCVLETGGAGVDVVAHKHSCDGVEN